MPGLFNSCNHRAYLSYLTTCVLKNERKKEGRKKRERGEETTINHWTSELSPVWLPALAFYSRLDFVPKFHFSPLS